MKDSLSLCANIIITWHHNIIEKRMDRMYLDVIETYGQDMAMHRSIEIAINVFTDADTETPCIYETVLHINVPSVHSIHSIK